MNAKDAIKQIREEDQPPGETPAAAAPQAPLPAAKPAATPAPADPTAEGGWEPWMQRLLEAARNKFIDERVKGFFHPGTGQTFAPVPQADAEARWLKAEPKFKAIIQSDPDIRAKFGMSADAGPDTENDAAPVAEPPLSEEPPASGHAAPPTS